MKEKQKSSIRLIVKLIYIFLLPFIFFQLIGDEPTKRIEQATRQIAVVNEDLGEDKEGESINFGQELSSVIGKGSEYGLVVVNRSAAENGLKNNRYDAVLYIPTNFTKNLLTFKENTPIKAHVQYKIQSNLDAKNREKIQKEMERIKNELNKEISTLYWGNVSQEIDHIRNQFEKIVEKEIAFQNAMYKFYRPGSEKLASEVNQQKNQLEQLLDSLKNVNNMTATSLDDKEQAKERLLKFSNDLQTYKEYQKQQREMIRQKLEENKKAIAEGLHQYEHILHSGSESIAGKKREHPSFKEEKKIVDDQFSSLLDFINGNLKNHQEKFSNVRYKQIEDQFQTLGELHQQLLTNYHQHANYLFFTHLEENLEELLNNEKTPPLEQRIFKNLSVTMKPFTEENEGDPGDEGETEKDRVQIILEKFERLKNLLNGLGIILDGTEIGQLLDEIGNDISTVVNELESEITELEAALDEKIKENEELHKQLQAAIKALEDLKEQIGSMLESLIKKIEGTEQSILTNELLPEERKERLEEIFSKELDTNNFQLIIDYYANLTTYAYILEKQEDTGEKLIEEILSLQFIKETLEKILPMSEEELKILDELMININETELSVQHILELYQAFFDQVIDEYSTFANKEYEEIVEAIGKIQDDTKLVTEGLNTVNNDLPEIKESPVEPILDSEIPITIHDNTIHDLRAIKEMVAALEERQSNVNSYTTELQSKVNDVQVKADELNNNWAMNVAFTEKVKEDVYEVLSNTLVDGQNNPYVYDYLANPVKISGDTPPEKTVQTPPVVIFIIISICAFFIGFFSHYYRKAPFMVQIALFFLLNMAVGLIISIYGLNIYPMAETEAIKWSVLTILLLFASSSLIKAGFLFGTFIGLATGSILTIYFVIPLLDLVLPNFSFYHSIANLYMAIQYNHQSNYYPVITFLVILTILIFALPVLIKRLQKKKDIAQDA